MNPAMQALADLLAAHFQHGFIVFLRVGPCIALLPAFGEQTIPTRIRLALALTFTTLIAPLVPASPAIGADAFFHLVFSETLFGLVLGLGIRLFVLALQVAGAIAAQSTSLAQILGGAGVEPMPAIGYVLMVGALALAAMTGLHVKAVEYLTLSYEILPIGQLARAADVTAWGVDRVTRAFALAFTLATPFVLLSVMYNLALGVINRAMPQLMVAFVGAPLITAGGLFLLFVSAPLILSVWLKALDLFLAQPMASPP